MSLYNAAALNDRYKEKLDSYKNGIEMNIMDSCQGFKNEYLSKGNSEDKICETVMLFLSDLKKEDDAIYRDSACKYIYYWLYNYALEKKETIENTLVIYKELFSRYNQYHDHENTFDNYINDMNKHTSDKLLKLTDMYNKLDDFYERKILPVTNDKCYSGVNELYAQYLDECRVGYDDDFCDELKIFRKKHNFIIQRVQLCQDEKYLLPPVVRINRVGITIIPLTLLSVTSFILPILYKFTALGPWIRHHIGKNSNVWYNTNEEPDQLLNIYEMENDNSNMRNYNIAYNSS
ncbi:PIR Superfamily Protein [Plasmodium ovale curtisi]|uniref:PIR Superfamily Protein n=1 Tax=Plasmodium ovale curtisi TaxID=864141 RepID=A0A1A8WB22_PLAOA|nr:PIR Superfamily Protein [Plasmodium ovale curtisi]SBT00097.1 PIR Superfamily Protein [Plasmodium ovale curtisi]